MGIYDTGRDSNSEPISPSQSLFPSPPPHPMNLRGSLIKVQTDSCCKQTLSPAIQDAFLQHLACSQYLSFLLRAESVLYYAFLLSSVEHLRRSVVDLLDLIACGMLLLITHCISSIDLMYHIWLSEKLW